jgi:hypothetical protein
MSYIVWTGLRFAAGTARRCWVSEDGIAWREEVPAPPGRLVWESSPAHSFAVRALAITWDGRIETKSAEGSWQQVRQPPRTMVRAIAFRP